MKKSFEGEPTMPEKKHEGYVSFTIDVEGDTSYFSVPGETFEKFRDIAKSRGVKMSDLLRAAIERYDFSADVMDKVINEEEAK